MNDRTRGPGSEHHRELRDGVQEVQAGGGCPQEIEGQSLAASLQEDMEADGGQGDKGVCSQQGETGGQGLQEEGERVSGVQDLGERVSGVQGQQDLGERVSGVQGQQDLGEGVPVVQGQQDLGARVSGVQEQQDLGERVSGVQDLGERVSGVQEQQDLGERLSGVQEQQDLRERLSGVQDLGERVSGVQGQQDLGERVSGVQGQQDLGEGVPVVQVQQDLGARVSGVQEQQDLGERLSGVHDLGERVSGVQGQQDLGERVSGVQGQQDLDERVSGVQGQQDLGERVSGVQGQQDLGEGVPVVQVQQDLGARVSGVHDLGERVSGVQGQQDLGERVLGVQGQQDLGERVQGQQVPEDMVTEWQAGIQEELELTEGAMQKEKENADLPQVEAAGAHGGGVYCTQNQQEVSLPHQENSPVTDSQRYAQLFTADTSTEAQDLENSIEEMLIRLDEFCAMMDMIRNETSLILEDKIPAIKFRVEEMNRIYCRVDKLEEFVKMVAHHASFLEEEVTRAERDHWTLPQVINGILAGAPLRPFRLTHSKKQSTYELPTLYRTEDYFPASCSDRKHMN